MKLMSECSGSVDHLKRVQLVLQDHEDPPEPGLSCSADPQTSTGTTGGLTLSRSPQPKTRRASDRKILTSTLFRPFFLI